jgi:putative FmdB family regulatory protein
MWEIYAWFQFKAYKMHCVMSNCKRLISHTLNDVIGYIIIKVCYHIKRRMIVPIYEYICSGCGELFEAFRAISADDADVSCPKCGRKNPKRKFSSFISKSSSGSSGKLHVPT